MMHLIIEGQRIELPKNTTIPMEEVLAFDEFESVPGEKSWKFTIPKTPQTRLAFGLADIATVVWNPATSYSCSIHVDGTLLKQGRLYIEQDTPSGFDVYFIGTVGVFSEKLGSTKLNELDWGQITGITNMFDFAKDASDNAVNIPAPFDVTFFPVTMPNIKTQGFPGYSINQMKIQVNPLATDNYLGYDDTIINAMVPFVFVKKLWQIIETRFDVIVDVSKMGIPEFQKLVFFNTIPLNIKSSSTNQYGNTFPNVIEISNHVPDHQLSTFLLDLAKLFNLMIIYNEGLRTVSIINRNEIFNFKRTVLNERIESLQILYEAQKRITLRYAIDEEEVVAANNWRFNWGNLPAGIDGGVDAEVVESDIGTLPMANRADNTEYYQPYSNDSLNSRTKTKLLIFHGRMQPFNSSFSAALDARPFASCDGRFVPASQLSLVWEGAGNTLFERHWRKYLQVLYGARTLKATMRIKSTELTSFNTAQVYVIDGMKCLVRKMEYDLQDDETIVDMELIKF
jgi:hypothetical protein